MHYYPHNIADYRKDTAHLSLLEHGIYRQLLDSYYLDEVPLTNDLAKLMRSHSVRTAEEQQALQNVLTDFFELTESGYIHKRCDSIISAYHGKSDKARASAMVRWSNKNKDLDANALPTESEGYANHKPITNNQEPITNKNLISMSESKIPTCPQEKILFLWKKHLPHLTQPRSWEGTRQQMLKQRWIQASKQSAYSDGYKSLDDGIDWWNDFFEYISKGTKLANGFESEGRVWKPTLEWILKLENFQKIIDGKYNK